MDKDANQTDGIHNGDGFLTKTDVAKYLRITTRTVDTWMNRGLIPFFKIGRTVRFKLEDVEDHLKHTCAVSSISL